MDKYVERTCTEVIDGKGEGRSAESRPLATFHDCSAYVLLGAPGAGKTISFKQEAAEGTYCDVRDFTTYGVDRWSDVKVLFIDGLDEMRDGPTDGRTPLDAIRGKLDALGRPRFRLSCREADWFGSPDWKRLESVSPDGVVKVLRLDPLSKENIHDILDREGVVHIDGFIDEAKHRGLGALLSNPQTLKLLAAAVDGGNWPATRADTFEAACSTLIRELNEEHLRAAPQRADSEMLRTAGHLCAVQLLSGQTGYRLPIRMDNVDGYIALRDIREPGGTLLAALHTKVFDVADGLATPIHRHIAEFLAGRYLSALIEDHLPVRRVLALLVGDDGRTVSGFRSLAAWLAVHCKAARDELVERDPVGTVLYGDVKGFSVGDKRRLLARLELDAERDPRVFARMRDLDSRWGDLATPDMEDAFREILSTTEESKGKQTVALALLTSLEHGALIPTVVPILLDIVRNDQCRRVVRDAALEAYLRQCHDAPETHSELKTLLGETHAGTISDPFDNILGRLLVQLYPTIIPPAQVVQYLRKPKRTDFLGWYEVFWNRDIVRRSTNDQLAEVLDALIELLGANDDAREHNWSSHWLRTTPGKLLSAYLERSPTVDHHRLFSWLQLASTGADLDASAKILSWLSENSAHYKALTRLVADRYNEPSRYTQAVASRLFDATPPSDFGEWCLTQVTQTELNTTAARDFFLERVLYWQDRTDVPDESVTSRLVDEPGLLARYRELRQLRQQRAANFADISAQRQQEREEDTKKRRKEWRNAVKAHEPALQANKAAPVLLHRLASAYLGQFVDVQGNTGRLRLRELLGDDSLVDTVVGAMRASTTRPDLPEVEEVLRLAAQNRHHFLMLPFLVGLHETPSLHPGEAPLKDQGMCRALAYLFNTPEFWDQQPGWYRLLLQCRPRLVADVLVRVVQSRLQVGGDMCLGVVELSKDKNYKPVAGYAVIPLLESFPTASVSGKLNVLRLLLHAARRNVAASSLQQIIETKLCIRSMGIAQRVYWLCTGLLIAPASFTGRLRQALTGRSRERRIRRLAEFLHDDGGPMIDALDVPALQLLIESLGFSFRPYYWPDDDSQERDTGAHHTAKLVDSLINVMASIPSQDATEALQHLSANPTLKPWQPELQDATSRQREVRREANFRHPSVKQVLETLDDRRPANASDLAALTKQLLCDLAREIRHGNTSDWRQYWNLDSNKRPQDPRPEEACRDALLSDLRQRLALKGVDAELEVTYADDKRADIRVSCDGFNVPIEIKKSTHDDLWKAIRSQLIEKYTRDPGAAGYGIYLVFWFGRDRCKRPPTGPAPETPAALREQLLAAANLSPEERRKISVCVIDVSKPNSQSDSIAT